MGALRNIVAGAITLALAFSYQAYRDLSKPLPKPELGKKKKKRFPFDFTRRSGIFQYIQINSSSLFSQI